MKLAKHLQIPRRKDHFDLDETVPILSSRVFLIEGEPTACCSPNVEVGDALILEGAPLWCTKCREWLAYGGTVGHSTRYTRIHTDSKSKVPMIANPAQITIMRHILKTSFDGLHCHLFQRKLVH
jgi:hypothetical protein